MHQAESPGFLCRGVHIWACDLSNLLGEAEVWKAPALCSFVKLGAVALAPAQPPPSEALEMGTQDMGPHE